MLGFNFFGSMSKLNLIGRERTQNRSQSTAKTKQFTTYFKFDEAQMQEPQTTSEVKPESAGEGNESNNKHESPERKAENAPEEIKVNDVINDSDATKETNQGNEEEVEARDTFEIHDSKFYRVMTKSFYDSNLNTLKPYQKNESPSVPRRTRKLTKKLSERKLVISNPVNFQRIENDFTTTLRKQMVLHREGTLKKSVSLDNLLIEREDDGSLFGMFSDSKKELKSNSLSNLSVDDNVFYDSVLEQVTLPYSVSQDSENCNDILNDTNKTGESDSDKESTSIKTFESEEDIDKIVEEYQSNLVQLRNMSKSTPELLKSVNQIQKDRSTPVDNKFPIDDETVQVRRHSSIARNRISKTTDFDAHKRKNDYHSSNAKNFEVRGVIKIQSSYGPNWLIKQKDEHVLYENENLYRVNNSTRKKELIKGGMVIRSARHLSSRGKESTEVELKDNFNYAYTLTFVSSKSAKQFMENDKIQVYASDHKVTIKDTLLRFLGKRSSREILEKKGIYKNEPIFGNTLKEIYIKSQILVPPFIHKILELIERPENIKSMGLYRTSGNLATIQKIRYDVDNGRLDLLENFAKDPDVLTGSLKLFFRELKEPLMPFEVYEKLAETIKIPLKLLSSKDHQKIRSTVVKYLYEANLATFRVIMRHLVEVVKYKEDNKMDAYNLAICWGPSLIFTNPVALTGPNPEFPKDLVSQSQDATRLVDFLIGYYEMYPSELGSRPESFSEKFLSLKRQESKDSIESADSSIKSYKKSNSNLSLSVDEVMKRAVEYIELNLSSDGLYQRSGTPEKTNKIMKKLNKKKSSELDKYRNDVYDMCDALKKYLKDYSEPLVDRNTVELLAMIFSHNQDHLEVNIRREAIATIEKTSRKDSLIYLLRHLAKVLNHQPFHKVTKHETIGLWTKVLNHEYRIHPSNETFAKFLTVAVEVFNDNLPDLVKSSFNNNGNSQNRNENMAEVLKDLRQHQERDRNSRYDNIDCEVIGEASLLDEKTEQTKL